MAQQEITAGNTTDFLRKINENFTELFGLSEYFRIIYTGTGEPSPLDGMPGDIYIQYEDET